MTGDQSSISQQVHQYRRTDPRTGRLYRIVSSPPPALRKAKLDNLALLPASLLPFKAEYQAIANEQPPGTTLVVLPATDSLPRRTLEQVAARMREVLSRVVDRAMIRQPSEPPRRRCRARR
jgi:hypothetical protein